MKIKKILILILFALAFIPNSVFAAKSCESYTADSCPLNNCLVEDGKCVKGHIGENFCSQDDVIKAVRVTGYFVLAMRIAVPLIIIIFGTFDIYKAVFGGDEKSLSASAKKFGIRFLIGFSVFLLPSILHIILSTLNSYNAISDDANICQTCLLKPSECEDGIPKDTNPFDDDLFEKTDEEIEKEKNYCLQFHSGNCVSGSSAKCIWDNKNTICVPK
ncbi:MAG: hypothetical protein J1F35_05015 [Erysipelotrichales bacterium]|nr:hypothetical protein [Erysipelotrichales bacterium]